MSMHNVITPPEVTYYWIPGFVGYCAGSDGSIWSLWNTRWGLGETWHRLYGQAQNSGHLVVVLYRGGKKHRRFIHRIILEVFVGPCPPGCEACHFPDRDPTNNRPENLRWATHAENGADMILHGTSNRGERNGRALLTEDDVRAIRARYAAGERRETLAREQGVHPETIRNVVAYRTWKHVSDDLARAS